MLTCTSLFSRFSSNAHHHGSLPQQLEGGLRPAPESRSRGVFPHLSRSLFIPLVHHELLIRVLLQHTESNKVIAEHNSSPHLPDLRVGFTRQLVGPQSRSIGNASWEPSGSLGALLGHPFAE